MISLSGAKKKVLNTAKTLGPEKIKFTSSPGRVLAEDVYAPFDIPRFDHATMDGYAVAAKDVKNASPENPATLDLIGDLPAGSAANLKVKPNCCIRIMTGAPMPEGADGVVMFEDTKEIGKAGVAVYRSIRPEENIAFAGEDVKKGELVLQKGTLICAAQFSMLAAMGKTEIKAAKKPVIAVIGTGDELVKPGKELKRGRIYDSNSYGICSRISECGGIPVRLGIAPDKKRILYKKIMKGLRYDMLILSGGVSKGIYDLVVETLKKAGVKTVFYKVAVKPGMPIFFGKKGKKIIFGLPGYPGSSMLDFENFARPGIFRMLGRNDMAKFKIRAVLADSIKNRSDCLQLIRVKLTEKNNGYYAVPARSQKSGALKSLIRANGLIYLPPGGNMEKGEETLVELLK